MAAARNTTGETDIRRNPQHRRQGVRGIQGSRNRQLVPAGARPRAGNASRNTRRHRRADATRDGGIIWQRPETPQAKRTSAGNSTNTSTPTSPGTCTTPTNPSRCAKPSDCPNKPNWSSTTTKSAPKTKPSATGRGDTTAKPAKKPKSSPADSSNKKARSSTP